MDIIYYLFAAIWFFSGLFLTKLAFSEKDKKLSIILAALCSLTCVLLVLAGVTHG